MTRIEIVVQLMAAHVASSAHGVFYKQEGDVDACERLADMIILYDDAFQEREAQK